MNWVFVDPLLWDYDVNTPMVQALGGSQSAMCYLAKALARRGHHVAMRTATTNPREIDGVGCYSCHGFPDELFRRPDTIVVVLNGPAEFAADYRPLLAGGAPLVLWTQVTPNLTTMMALCDAACEAMWDRVVCVSNWQKAEFHERLDVPLAKMDVLKNAIGPAFERLFRDRDDLAEAKGGTVRLAYTSAPFRGLDVLLLRFPELRRRHGNCELHIYSSLQVYSEGGARDKYQPMYAWCRATEGAVYHGSLAQPQLAAQLRVASILAYPSTFEETSCIAALEAMAAGALVITSDFGALVETCGAWGRYIPPLRPPRTREEFEADFLQALDSATARIAAEPEAFAIQQFEQVRAMNEGYTWDVRAAEWEAAGTKWLGGA